MSGSDRLSASERAPARRPRVGEHYQSDVHGVVEVRAVWQEGVVVVGNDLEACFTWAEFFQRFTRVSG